MRLRFYPFLLVVISALILAACTSKDGSSTANPNAIKTTPSSQSVYADGIARVTIPELEELLKKNQAVVIDVRNQESFDQEHIPGSKLIPEAEIVARSSELPRDKMIVTYCS
jgi:3-mercaptopyruvate sulfurtransferase SseA